MKPRYFIITIALVALAIFVACSDDDDGTSSTGETPGAVATEPGETTEPVATAAGQTPDQPFAEACVKSDEKQWAAPPPRIIDTSKTYVATISTEQGDIVVDLYSDTPVTTNNFVFLACNGFYDGLTFHRVVADFVIQGGDPTGSGSGGPGYAIEDEADPGHLMDEGVISMANSGPDTAGSQFFVTIGLGAQGDLSYLDPDFTVFGEVAEGLDVAKEIAQGDTIETITITEQ